MTQAPIWWKMTRVPLIIVLVAYLALAGVALLFANDMLHHPEMGSRRAPNGLKKLRTSEGKSVAVLHLPNPQARFTLWFFHGNAEDLGDIEPTLQQLHDAGYAVYAVDYPGYGFSDGQPSEAALYAAARVARDYLRAELHVPAAQTILFGRSLGSGVAVQLATEERVAGLVVQSGFMSAFRVVTRWPLLPFDQFRNLGKLRRVSCPVLVMHGEGDEVIAVAHGRALFDAAPEPKRHLWVAGAYHNDFAEVAGEKLWVALREFSALCASASR